MILHFRDSAGQPRDRVPRSRRGPEENAADFGPLIFLGKSSLPWEVEVVGSGGSGMEKKEKNEKKKMALWGGVLRHPPRVDLGDKRTKPTFTPLKPAWLRESRGDKRG